MFALTSAQLSVCGSLEELIDRVYIMYTTQIPPTPTGVLAVVAGGLVLLLPETRGAPLPETIDDIEHPQR